MMCTSHVFATTHCSLFFSITCNQLFPCEVVAEGAGQSHVAAGAHLEEEDATGGSLKRSKRNARGQAVLDDIGVWLCDAIQEHFSGAAYIE